MNTLRGCEISRRKALSLSGLGLVAAAGFSVFSPSTAQAADEFEMLLSRYAELLAGPPDADTSSPTIQATLATMASTTEALLGNVVDGPDRDRVFADQPLSGADSAPIQTTALNLSSMAKTWAAPGSPYNGDPDLASVVVAGIQTLHDLQYNASTAEFGNWYHFEIGAPRGILEATALMGAAVPAGLRNGVAAAVAHFVPDPNYQYPPGDERRHLSSGSNRLFLCQNVLVAAALVKDGARLQLASDAVPPAIALTTSGDGLYSDGSLIAHDNVPYTGTYGRAMVTSTSYILPLLGGSRWDLKPEDADPFRKSIVRAFVPWTSQALTMPPVCGRAVARGDTDSAWLMGNILMLAEGASPDLAAQWQGYVKGWLQEATAIDFFTRRPLPEALLGERLLASDVLALHAPNGPDLFPQMDRVLSRGPGWCFSLATESTRTRGFETQSGQNIKAWHQGSGARYLYLEAEQEQYLDWFPTVDPYRMPGTTVDSQRLGPSSGGKGSFAFVGGSAVGGSRGDDGYYRRPRYATWVQQLKGYDSAMVAKLSWFFLPDGVVCLGSDITGGSVGNPVETILENRAIKTAQMERWHVNGRAVPESGNEGWRATLDGVESMSLPGTASFVMLGGPRRVDFLRETRSGSFADIAAGYSTEVHTETFHTAWLNHGPQPAGASYAYLMLPLADPARAQARFSRPGVQVLRNDSAVQAVWAPAVGFASANFHSASDVDAGPLRVWADRETSVSVLRARARAAAEDEGGVPLQIAVSDASQSRDVVAAVVRVPSGRRLRVASADPTVEVGLAGGRVTITCDTSARDGRSHHADVLW